MYLPLLHHRYAHPNPDPNPNPNPDPNPNPNPSPNRVQVRTKKSVDAFLTGEDKRQWLELVGDKLLELAKATTTEGKRADKDGAGAKGPKKGKAKGAKGGGGEAGEGGPGSPSKGNLLQIDFDVKITVRLRSGTLAPAPAPAPALALALTLTRCTSGPRCSRRPIAAPHSRSTPSASSSRPARASTVTGWCPSSEWPRAALQSRRCREA